MIVPILFGTLLLTAQLPNTELFMITFDDDSTIEKVSYLSDFNPNQYNNQAVFISDNEILLTTQWDENNTDITKLNLQANTVKRLTNTLESEYSPNINGDGSFTVVRVEQDETTQNLWEYPLSLDNEGSILVENTGQVGYYQHLPNLNIALFVIEEDQYHLEIINQRSQQKKKIDQNIGRCFKRSKKGELIYLSKSTTGKNDIMTYNAMNDRKQKLATALGDAVDFCLYGNLEQLIMAKDNALYRYDAATSTWLLWHDLAPYGLKRITRMDARGNQLLLINNKS